MNEIILRKLCSFRYYGAHLKPVKTRLYVSLVQNQVFTALQFSKSTLRSQILHAIKGGESSSQFRWFTIAKIEL